MSRVGWLAIIAAALAAGQASAQFGGMGGGGFGGGMQETRRSYAVEVEAAGGKHLSGPIRIGSIVIEGDFGRYEIKPEKVRTIRLAPDPDQSPNVPMGMGGMGGGMGGMGSVPVVAIAGSVVAASGEEIGGTLFIPQDWTITTDLGTLTLDPSKLRSITFLDEPEGAEPAKPAEGGLGDREEPPRIMRMGGMLWAFSPSGHRIAVRVAEEGETRTLELPATEEAPLSVTTVWSAGIAALHLEGPKITRIAVFSFVDKDWHPQDLREPIAGKVSPIVSKAIAVYGLGRHVYAFSAEANRWDVLELPEDVSASPIVNNDSVLVEYDGHVHTFPVKTGEWTHTDVRNLLDSPGEDAEEGVVPRR